MTMVDAYESDVYWGVNSDDDIFLSQGGYIQTVNSGDNINLGQQTGVKVSIVCRTESPPDYTYWF
jgi:hypothetical protein